MALISDTYITVEEADTYHQNHNPGGGWSSADQADKEAAINSATEWLESVPEWIGSIYQSSQPLAWPRDVETDRNGRDLETPYPKRVKVAAYNLALAALDGPLVKNLEKKDQVKNIKAGPVEIEFEKYANAQRDLEAVRLILKPLTIGATANSVPVVRVQ